MMMIDSHLLTVDNHGKFIGVYNQYKQEFAVKYRYMYEKNYRTRISKWLSWSNYYWCAAANRLDIIWQPLATTCSSYSVDKGSRAHE